MSRQHPIAVLAEDETLLAQALRADLARAWPELEVVALATTGEQALAAIFEHRPDVAFLDIRMPAMSGMEVAQAVLEDWPDAETLPDLVFVTAYDAHAVEAFDVHAVDYLLKPVTTERMQRTVERLQARYPHTTSPDDADDLVQKLAPILDQLAAGKPRPEPPLRHIKAAVGASVRLIPVDDIVYLQATDKYVNVVTANAEALVRTSLGSLLHSLDARFTQVHRSAVVNLDFVTSAERDDSGKLTLSLSVRKERLKVSRLYAHVFRPM